MSVSLEPSLGMSSAAAGPRPALRRLAQVAIAALAMVATLPGRTHGLGLITEPLLADLHLGRVEYGSINLWATLLGAAFCLPCGWLMDRIGVRAVLTGTLLALGGVVVAMSRVRGDGAAAELFLAVLLTRGLGQSALSVVSLTLVGRAAGPRPGRAVGVYSVLVAVGFMAAFAVVKYVLETVGADWRTLWAGVGVVLLGFGAVAWLAVPPEAAAAASAPGEEARPADGLTLGQSLRTPAFWVFALATSLYGLITSGISLFNQSVLEERGFARDVFLNITMISPFIGLAGNLATGWLSSYWSFGRLLAVAMGVLAAALLAFPFVATLPQVYLYAAAFAAAGGMVTVIFFAVWVQAFGPAHLGKIQGAAQMLTVLASAVGPLALAACREGTGSYVPLFQSAAAVAAVLAACAWCVPAPRPIPSARPEPAA